MDDLAEAEALEAALDALGGSPTTAQILEVLKGGYRDAGVAAALKRTGGGGGGVEPPLQLTTEDETTNDIQFQNNVWDNTDPAGNGFIRAMDDGRLWLAAGFQPLVLGQAAPARCVIFLTASEPTDGTLGTAEFTLWLDSTPGATKLMVKAKDDNGAVRTAAVALS